MVRNRKKAMYKTDDTAYNHLSHPRQTEVYTDQHMKNAETNTASPHPHTSVKMRLRMLTIVISFIILIALLFFLYIPHFKNSLYAERAYHLSETSAQITITIDKTMEAQWNQLDTIACFISNHPDVDTQSLLSMLSFLATSFQQEKLIFSLIDDTGTCYWSDGKVQRNPYDDIMKNTVEPRQTFIHTSDAMKPNEHMVFSLQLNDPIVLTDGRIITHVVSAQDMRIYNAIARSSVYADQNAAFVLSQTGEKVYQDTNEYTFFHTQNDKTELENVQILNGDSVTDIQENLRHRKSSLASVRANGGTYFLTIQPMSHNNWNLLMVVPEAYVSAQTSAFANSIFIATTVMTCAILATIFFSILFWIRAKNQAQMLQREQRSNLTLAATAKQATRASKAKSKFLSYISHDFRTPINGIIGMLHIAEKNATDPDTVKECLKKIRSASNHLLSLINDVLDISKLESGKTAFQNEPFSMRTLLDNCCSIIQGQLLSKNIQFHTDFSGIVHDYVSGSELNLRQILINVLGNAVKYTNQGEINFTVVEHNASDDTAEYEFIISDTGVGMSEDLQKHIFEAFVRGNNAARKTYHGTGLGMAIVKHAVDQMGGMIQVKSRINEGSTFRIQLCFPLTEKPVYHSPQHVDTAQMFPISGMHILLAEDNDLNMEIAKMILEDAGITVDTAGNGKEVLDLFLNAEPGTYHLILMDVMMPMMGGLEATREIRKSNHPDAKTIPIIAQTANVFSKDVAAVKAAGMNEHIAKPLDEYLLLQTLYHYYKPMDGKIEPKTS